MLCPPSQALLGTEYPRSSASSRAKSLKHRRIVPHARTVVLDSEFQFRLTNLRLGQAVLKALFRRATQDYCPECHDWIPPPTQCRFARGSVLARGKAELRGYAVPSRSLGPRFKCHSICREVLTTAHHGVGTLGGVALSTEGTPPNEG